MSLAQTLLLGAIAGATIFVGLPAGRLGSPSPRLRAALTAGATGVLVFLVWDILTHAFAPVEEAAEEGAWAALAGRATVLAAGLAAGLVGLAAYERRRQGRLAGARDLALTIATGIGLHNFSEGLAIGQSAALGQLGLAALLVAGFALHNATEGFGIVAPLAGEPAPPSWSFLALLGLAGGGPTFLGAAVGRVYADEVPSIAFLALAAGSILYVVVQLLPAGARLGHPTLASCALLAGLLLGCGTELVLEAAGA